MYGGKFAFQNRLGQPYFWKEIYFYSLFYFVLQNNFQVQAPGGGGGGRGGLYLEGRFNGRFFALRAWGAYIWRGLYIEGLIFGTCCDSCSKTALIEVGCFF